MNGTAVTEAVFFFFLGLRGSIAVLCEETGEHWQRGRRLGAAMRDKVQRAK